MDGDATIFAGNRGALAVNAELDFGHGCRFCRKSFEGVGKRVVEN